MNDYLKLIQDTKALLTPSRPQVVLPQVKTPPPPPPKKKAPEKPLIIEEPKSPMERILNKAVPSLRILNTIPSDDKAKRIKESWKEHYYTPDIPILSLDEHPFLSDLARAIHTRIGTSRVLSARDLEADDKWEFFLSSKNLKWILLTENLLTTCPNLHKHFSPPKHLGKTPVLILPPLTLYTKDPSLKRSLWKQLTNLTT